MHAKLLHDNYSIYGDIFVVKDQSVNLLSKRACQALHLLFCSVNETDVEEFKSVFVGLGPVKDVSYQIKLVDDYEPYAVTVPRPVPLPLLEKTKAEQERMVGLGVIERVRGPTDWCSPNGSHTEEQWEGAYLCRRYTAQPVCTKRSISHGHGRRQYLKGIREGVL